MLKIKYFVLKPTGDTPYAEASREAMRAFAEVIREHDPDLARDLISWAARSEVGESFRG